MHLSENFTEKKVKVLSGGEKTRLSLCKLLLQPNNFLILDEPTNHLDMASKEILKEALLDYKGTLLLVSHDRDFLDGLTEKVYFIKDQNVLVFKKLLRNRVLDFSTCPQLLRTFQRNAFRTRSHFSCVSSTAEVCNKKYV